MQWCTFARCASARPQPIDESESLAASRGALEELARESASYRVPEAAAAPFDVPHVNAGSSTHAERQVNGTRISRAVQARHEADPPLTC
jgi:hypothetical protein